ncbi:hypothetical protein SH611_16245 [Geminicoccaceae bacterium 1502E]|nr:hypothetical protein [Geminicoccaceae bacterium 1502E]
MTSTLAPDDPSAIDYQVHEAVGVFTDPLALEDAIDALQSEGFDRAQINIMASRKAVERKLGHRLEDIREAEDDPRVPIGTFVSHHEVAEGQAALAAGLFYVGSFAATGAVVATGGGLAAIVAAAIAAGGVGGALGAWLARYLGRRHARTLAEHVKAGGLLLLVEVGDPPQERRALDILTRHGASDVHAHELTRSWGAEQVPLRRWQPDPFLFPER